MHPTFLCLSYILVIFSTDFLVATLSVHIEHSFGQSETGWRVSKIFRRLQRLWRWLLLQSSELFKLELKIHVAYGSHLLHFLVTLLVSSWFDCLDLTKFLNQLVGESGGRIGMNHIMRMLFPEYFELTYLINVGKWLNGIVCLSLPVDLQSNVNVLRIWCNNWIIILWKCVSLMRLCEIPLVAPEFVIWCSQL